MAKITTSDIHGLGFQARPAEGGPYPGLVVIQEFWGVNEHIKDVTQRLAGEGFVALAADLYDGRVTKDPTEARNWLMALDQQAALKKLNDAVETLKKDSHVDAKKIGVIGFCMGGFHSLNLAGHNADVRAVAAFYGRVPADPVLNNVKAPVKYFVGGKDHHIPADDIRRLEEFLKRTGKGEVIRYPEADHAFLNDTRKEVYRADDAKDAWGRALTFLRKNLS